MRSFSVFAVLAASPAMAHDTGLPHANTDWALPVGLCLIALAAGAATLHQRLPVRVRK